MMTWILLKSLYWRLLISTIPSTLSACSITPHEGKLLISVESYRRLPHGLLMEKRESEFAGALRFSGQRYSSHPVS